MDQAAIQRLIEEALAKERAAQEVRLKEMEEKHAEQVKELKKKIKKKDDMPFTDEDMKYPFYNHFLELYKKLKVSGKGQGQGERIFFKYEMQKKVLEDFYTLFEKVKKIWDEGEDEVVEGGGGEAAEEEEEEEEEEEAPPPKKAKGKGARRESTSRKKI